MQARYAPEATAAYSLNRQGDAFLPIQKPQPPPRKKQKPKKLTALDRYLQWLEWDEKKEARALAPLLPVMSALPAICVSKYERKNNNLWHGPAYYEGRSANGRILGHEDVGVVDQIGAHVSNFKIGDHVIISCISFCGRSTNCKKGMYSHCENGGGWILGNVIDGTQAEFVRIPFADNSLYAVPHGIDEEDPVMLCPPVTNAAF